MKKNYTEETFLARWVAGKLSKEELITFKRTKEYAEFKLINEESLKLKTKSPNLEKDFIKVKEKISNNKKVRKLKPIYISIAASILFLVGLFPFLNASKTYTTLYGQQQQIVLPDGSIVELNSGSKISYKRFFWKNDKVVNLEGEAFFKVKKGGAFKVVSKSGAVNVLGTKFNIKDRNTYLLNCFSGKVTFHQKTNEKNYTLEKGDAILIKKEKIVTDKFTDTNPDWLQGFSQFKNTKIRNVIQEIERQYNVKIVTNNIVISKLYSGSFVHNNLENALKTTLIPMTISYKIATDKKTIYLE